MPIPGWSAEEKITPDKREAAPGGDIGKYRNEGIDVVQGRIFRKGLRHEFSVDGGIIPNNQFLSYQLLQFHYTFHFREALAFEGWYARALHQEKNIIDDLRSVPCPPSPAFVDVNGDGVQDTNCGVELTNPPDPLQNAFFGNVVWSPLYGKFSIFSKKIFHFDFYFTAGAGLFDNEDSNRFAFNVGGGWKVFLNDWAAFKVDVRDIVVREGAPFNHVVNNMLFSLGVSFFLPPHPAPLGKDAR